MEYVMNSQDGFNGYPVKSLQVDNFMKNSSLKSTDFGEEFLYLAEMYSRTTNLIIQPKLGV